MSDNVTILKCLGKLLLTKKWLANGGVSNYDEAKHYYLREENLNGFSDLADLLDRLAGSPQQAVIRGKWAADVLPAKGEKVVKRLTTFKDAPHHWVLFDIDEYVPKSADPVLEPETAIEEFIQTHLPECFHFRSYRWNLTGSAGHPKNQGLLKARVAFWLSRPYGSDALEAWVIANAIPVDRRIFNTVQLHYTAAPVFEDGVVDPVPVRYGRVQGFEDEVDLEIPDSVLAQVKAREHTGSGIELKDPGEKAHVIGAFCRAYPPARCIEEFEEIPYEYETPGDNRRLNFLDGGGAPGGAFITDCGNYIVCTHNSDPFLNKPINSFELIRHYKFGDRDANAFDADPTTAPSRFAAEAYAKTLPDVQAEIQAADTEQAGDTGDALLAQLRSLTIEETRAQWLTLLLDAGPIAEDTAISHLSSVLNLGRRPMHQALRQARAARETQARRDRLDERTGAGRTRVLYLPEASVRQARLVEKKILSSEKIEAHDYLHFSGLLSHVVEQPLPKSHRIDDPDAPAPAVPSFRRMSRVTIRSRVEDVVVFTRASDGAPPSPIEVPSTIIEALADMESPGAPQVSGLVTHPVALQSGRILSKPGLDSGSGLLLWGTSVSGCRPYDEAEAKTALDRIREDFLVGFDFEDLLDESIALAALFTAVERRAMDQAPAFLITASTQGTGKTTLARRIHLYLTGRDMPTVTYPKTGEEADKLLFTLLLSGPAMVCFDNVPDGFMFKSATLNQILTAPYFEQRLLGENRSARVPTDVFFTVTGNHLGLGRDELTRFLEVKLTSREERPDARAFAVCDIVGHALAAREDVLRDVVGIVAGYRRAKIETARASRFDAWDGLVRQPLLWAGAKDPVEGFNRNHSESEDTILEHALLSEAHRCFDCNPFTAADMLDRAHPFGKDDKVLHRVLENACEHRGFQTFKGITARHVGRLMSGLVGKRVSIHDVKMALRKIKTNMGYTFRVWTEFEE